MEDTICAISTALQKGAIAIVRLSGPDTFPIIRQISDLQGEYEPNTIRYGHVYDEQEQLDEVLISFFKAPRSYTGEDLAEINCHGSPFTARRILKVLLRHARAAEPGEFTRRAYLNGRITLAQAEAANDMVNSFNILQSRSALRGLDGSVSRLLEPLMEDMRQVLSMIEVNIDYPEYEDEKQMDEDVIRPEVEKWILRMEEMIRQAERFLEVKDGLKTAIIGKPNVGKSSLLNALSAKEKAIVTDVAGTTRDLIEENVDLGSLSLHLIDTAGIRESEDKVEKIGIERSRKAIAEADLILLVLDGSAPLDEEDRALLKMTENKERIILYNKADILRSEEEGIHISAKENDLQELISYLEEKYEPAYSLADQDVLTSTRQVSLMQRAKQCLQEYLASEDLPLDIAGEELTESYSYLSEILGKEYREDLIDHMFRNFCLGK